jgi:hypothetical protein
MAQENVVVPVIVPAPDRTPTHTVTTRVVPPATNVDLSCMSYWLSQIIVTLNTWIS